MFGRAGVMNMKIWMMMVGLFQKKNELSAAFFETPPWYYEVFYFTHGNSRRNKVSPQLETPQN